MSEAPFDLPREQFTWLDDDHCYRPLHTFDTLDQIGISEFHRVPVSDRVPSGWCGGTVIFEGVPQERWPGARWQPVQREPLTLFPSVLCSCGEHGFIRDGKWVGVA